MNQRNGYLLRQILIIYLFAFLIVVHVVVSLKDTEDNFGKNDIEVSENGAILQKESYSPFSSSSSNGINSLKFKKKNDEDVPVSDNLKSEREGVEENSHNETIVVEAQWDKGEETASNQTQQQSENIEVNAKKSLTKSKKVEKGQFVSIEISKNLHTKYRFLPTLISHSKILYLNARNINYYLRDLKKPFATVWLLTSTGAKSNKKNTLCYSIKRLIEEAYNMNIQVKVITISKLDLSISKDGLTNIAYNGEKVEKLPDVVLPRLAAHVSYFGLAVVRQLEKMGVLIINEFNSLEISRDKLYTLQQLGANNIPIPKTMIVKFPVNYTYIKEEFGYPLVLKRSSGSQGKGVILIQNPDHLKDLVEVMDLSKHYILQEFISKSSGRDIRVIVIGGKAIGGMMRIAKKGFRSNFHQGGYTKVTKLDNSLEWLAINAANLLGLDIAGVDILIDKETYKICEINSTPGFKGFELATGINVAKRIMNYVKFRSGIWKSKKQPRKSDPITIPVMVEHLTLK